MANKQSENSKRKLIPINQWEKLLQNEVCSIPLIDGNPDSPLIEVRRLLPMSEMWDAVDEITEYCVPTIDIGTADAPREETVFMPENKDFALRRIVVSYYGNLRLPKDAAKQYELLYSTDVYSRIKEHVCEDQLNAIYVAASYKIDFRKESMLSISATISKFINKFANLADQLGDIDQSAVQQAIKLLSDTESVSQQVVEQAVRDAAKSDASVDTDASGDNVVYLKQ